MALRLPSYRLDDTISTLWSPNALQLNRSSRSLAPRHEPAKKRRKLIAALQNRGYNLQRSADTISDDEQEFENQYGEVRGFGYGWMIPSGRHTSQEDEADAFLDPAEHDEASPGPRPTMTHPLLGAAARPHDGAGAENAEQDLDANVEDRDEEPSQANITSQSNTSSMRDQENDEEPAPEEEEEEGNTTDSA